jgi:hypothetical protein
LAPGRVGRAEGGRPRRETPAGGRKLGKDRGVARPGRRPTGQPGGHRAGVVKPLRARGGCLGAIRIRAWKAAISPGELPNERRSRNARADPGN